MRRGRRLKKKNVKVKELQSSIHVHHYREKTEQKTRKEENVERKKGKDTACREKMVEDGGEGEVECLMGWVRGLQVRVRSGGGWGKMVE